MPRNFVLIPFSLLGLVFAQDVPPAPQAADFKGVTLKKRAPVSNEVLKVKFPKPVESKLKNGVELLVLEDHRSPTIQVTIDMPASNLNDAPELAGISDAGNDCTGDERAHSGHRCNASTLRLGALPTVDTSIERSDPCGCGA